MKSEKFLEAIGKIDDKLILDAFDEPALEKAKKSAVRIRWVGVAVAAACIVIMARLFPKDLSGGSLPELPMLVVEEDEGTGMGYEGCLAYDITELVNANPWSENEELSTLPVYESPLSYGEYFLVSGVDLDAMKALLLEAASRLGMDTDALEINVLLYDEEMAAIEKSMGKKIPEGSFDPSTRVTAEMDGIKIEVDTEMTATITFETAIALPEGYRWKAPASYANVRAVAGYLEENYRNLIKMENPQVNVCGGDRNIYHEQGYRILFYDAADSLTKQMINYNFNTVEFYCNENEELYMVRIYQPDLSGKLGDYPVISAKEARKLLLDGSYMTSVPYEMPSQEYIADVELVYLPPRRQKYLMPYYRFYVELPEEERESGLKMYGAYYVPAVRGEYITNRLS